MVIEPKVSLTITLQGRVMLSQEEAKSLEKQSGKGYDKFSMIIENPHNKKDRETIKFSTRRNRTISQHLNINKEAYRYMTDNSSCPENIKMSQWGKMSNKEKLEAHMQLICESLGGLAYSYEVFDD